MYIRGLGLWSLTPLSTIFRLYRGSQFNGGGNRSTRLKPLTCRKSHAWFGFMVFSVTFNNISVVSWGVSFMIREII